MAVVVDAEEPVAADAGEVEISIAGLTNLPPRASPWEIPSILSPLPSAIALTTLPTPRLPQRDNPPCDHLLLLLPLFLSRPPEDDLKPNPALVEQDEEQEVDGDEEQRGTRERLRAAEAQLSSMLPRPAPRRQKKGSSATN